MSSLSDEFVDLAFRVDGDLLPADHGYRLFSALSSRLSFLDHKPGDESAIQQIMGDHVPPQQIRINERSRLRLRLRLTNISEALSLSGTPLRIMGHDIYIGPAEITKIWPWQSLYSRLVVFSEAKEPEADQFLSLVKSKMQEMEIGGRPSLIKIRNTVSVEGKQNGKLEHGPWVSRTVDVKGVPIRGFAVKVNGLSPEHSVCLQCRGLGGRRHFGCGVFVGAKEE